MWANKLVCAWRHNSKKLREIVLVIQSRVHLKMKWLTWTKVSRFLPTKWNLKTQTEPSGNSQCESNCMSWTAGQNGNVRQALARKVACWHLYFNIGAFLNLSMEWSYWLSWRHFTNRKRTLIPIEYDFLMIRMIFDFAISTVLSSLYKMILSWFVSIPAFNWRPWVKPRKASGQAMTRRSLKRVPPR